MSLSHINIMNKNKNISHSQNQEQPLPPVFDALKKDAKGFQTPENYFETFNLKINSKIENQENTSFFKLSSVNFRAPQIWAPSAAVVIVAIMLLFVIPSKTSKQAVSTDEITDMRLSYDASYADEALLAESQMIDSDIERKDAVYLEAELFGKENELTTDEMTELLKEQDIDTELLTQN